MTDDDLLTLFWSYHKERLLSFAVWAACGNLQDAEDGLADAILSRWQKILDHFKSVSIDDRTTEKAIDPFLLLRIRDRVRSVRGKSRKHNEPLGQSLLGIEALDNRPANTGNDAIDAAVDRVAKLLTVMNQIG